MNNTEKATLRSPENTEDKENKEQLRKTMKTKKNNKTPKENNKKRRKPINNLRKTIKTKKNKPPSRPVCPQPPKASLLHFAAQRGKPGEELLALMRAGVRPNARAFDGRTPLDYAGDAAMPASTVRILLAKGKF